MVIPAVVRFLGAVTSSSPAALWYAGSSAGLEHRPRFAARETLRNPLRCRNFSQVLVSVEVIKVFDKVVEPSNFLPRIKAQLFYLPQPKRAARLRVEVPLNDVPKMGVALFNR